MPPHRTIAAAKQKKMYAVHFHRAVLLFCITAVCSVTVLIYIQLPPGFRLVNFISNDGAWEGDLRGADFAWNKLYFNGDSPPPAVLRIAVFSKKWPTSSDPGGMERHAQTLYAALAARGHHIHVFTSPANPLVAASLSYTNPVIHFHDGEPNNWQYEKAWEMFEEEDSHRKFDVIHTESVALPFRLAERLPNLAVSWHGIAYEIMQSSIFQDLIRKPDEPQSNDFIRTLNETLPKLLKEIRFFSKYAHHVAITDSCGEVLRNVYQIPSRRVHVILNGVDQRTFVDDPETGLKFRSQIGIPQTATLVLGVSGRLVRDKGHPLLFDAFSKLKVRHPDVYLIVAGTGPWGSRYRELGSQVLVLGSLDPVRLKGFYNAIDVFVNPTLRPQGLDLTLMEAMMSGKPIMASNFPSIKGSLVVDDEFGFTFPPNADSLYEALELAASEGKERLRRRGLACKKYAAAMFTAGKMALAYERLFLCIYNESYCFYP
ncbi:hypothetical protein M569_10883 [Genlisea aurea]|uniref:Glycosyltransferase subfamily 4-like N-terminal domain-containing protein n=1 Tax=Genlisea aurea TaxID=192259 RepID=S8CAN5_9LAMI|nr:hypothetical protein M569_10883 [Genlisea aurea]